VRAIRHVAWIVLVLSAAQAGGQQPVPPDDSTLFASPTRKDRIGRIMAPVMINGRGPFRLIVDTGASYSTVSPQLAQTLGLEPNMEMPILVNGITGTAKVPSVPIDVLQAGDLVFRDLRLPVVWAPLMAGADGILGVAGLKDERIIVEFTRNRVTISRSPRNVAPPGYIKIPAIRMQNGLMVIDARVGGVRARAVVDTGAERSLGNQALRDALRKWRSPQKRPNYTDVYGSTSEVVQGEFGISPTIHIGPMKVVDVALVYGDFHIFEVWNMRAKPALIIGMDVLGTVRGLGIDFRNQELYIEGAYLGVGEVITLSCTGVGDPHPSECEG
jgi:predicted aspartyl protease